MNDKSNASSGPYEFKYYIKITHSIIKYKKDRHTFMELRKEYKVTIILPWMNKQTSTDKVILTQLNVP
jgi:hypothetical protein